MEHYRFLYGIGVGIPVGGGLLFAGLFLYFELQRALSPTIWLRLQVTEKSDYLEISNRDDFDWTDIWLTVNGRWAEGGYGMALPRIPAGTSKIVALDDLAARDGRRFNPQTQKAIHLHVRAKTDRGEGRWAGDIP